MTLYSTEVGMFYKTLVFKTVFKLAGQLLIDYNLEEDLNPFLVLQGMLSLILTHVIIVSFENL